MCEKQFLNYVGAGYPLLWVQSHEEHRVMSTFVLEVNHLGRTMFCWDRVSGIKSIVVNKGVMKFAVVDTGMKDDPGDPLMCLDWFNHNVRKDAVLFLLDWHHYAAKESARRIRNFIEGLEGPSFGSTGRAICIIAHNMEIPAELDKVCTPIKFRLPEVEELRTVLQSVCESTGALYPSEDELILKAAQGLTHFEAENAFSISLVESKGKEFLTKTIQREKATAVRKSGSIEVLVAGKNINDIGGLDNLKVWLTNRLDSFSNEARADGIDLPKGIILAGPPGTGKSLSAKAVATILDRPLLRFDVGAVFASHIGESEANMDDALRIAEAVAPCVLFLDEIDKAFGGADGDYDGDGGTSKKVYQKFLVWLGEKTKDVFVVATANNVSILPSALLRSGRFNAMFWVDLPEQKQREEIFIIHLRRVKRDPAMFNVKALAEATKGYTGAEIENIIQESLILARVQKQAMADVHLLACVPEVTPISKLMSQDIQKSRKWAEEHGVKYANPKVKEAITADSSKRKINFNSPVINSGGVAG
jgi:SpoVK/Ycf46/Vps4 family AAA+-type ATPase